MLRNTTETSSLLPTSLAPMPLPPTPPSLTLSLARPAVEDRSELYFELGVYVYRSELSFDTGPIDRYSISTGGGSIRNRWELSISLPGIEQKCSMRTGIDRSIWWPWKCLIEWGCLISLVGAGVLWDVFEKVCFWGCGNTRVWGRCHVQDCEGWGSSITWRVLICIDQEWWAESCCEKIVWRGSGLCHDMQWAEGWGLAPATADLDHHRPWS